MKKLPTEIVFESDGKRVKLFHATPHKNNLYWFEDRPEKFFREMAEKADADVLVYGHTHKPNKRDFSGKTFINAGSVGKPKDGDPRACVAVIEITSNVSTVDFLRVTYDMEKISQEIISSGLPPYFAERLKKAG
jgi:putative phosphoesterase